METQADEAATEPTGQNSPVLNENNFTNVIEIGHENKPHSVSDQGSLSEVTECRRSTRERKLNQKGKEYILELKRNIFKQTKCCLVDKLSSLKTEVSTLEGSSITYEIEQLETLVKEFNQNLDELLKLLEPEQRESYITECQSVLNDWNNVKGSLVLNMQKYEIDNIRSNHQVSLPEDRKSTTSSVRTSSSIQEKKLQARAKVAALRSKIVVEEEIIEQKNLLAKHEAHLEKLKMKQQLAEAEAEVEVYEEAENDQDQIPALPKNRVPSPTTSNNNLNNKITRDNVTPAPLPVSQNVSAPDKSMNYNAPPFTPPQNSIRSAPDQQHILVPGNEQIPHTPTFSA